MALHEITLQYNAVDVAVSGCIRHGDSDAVIIAVLYREGHALYTWPLDSKAQNMPWLSSTQDESSKDEVSEKMNLQIICSREGSVSCLSNNSDMSIIWPFGHNKSGPDYVTQPGKMIEGIVSPGPQSGRTIYLTPNQNEDVGVERRPLNGLAKPDGIRFFIFHSSHSVVESTSWQREAHVPTNSLTNGVSTPATEDVIFSLAESGTLFANERRLVRNCTSFLVTPVLLIFTTSQHLLKFVQLADDVNGKHKILLSMDRANTVQLLKYHQTLLSQTRDAVVSNVEPAL